MVHLCPTPPPQRGDSGPAYSNAANRVSLRPARALLRKSGHTEGFNPDNVVHLAALRLAHGQPMRPRPLAS